MKKLGAKYVRFDGFIRIFRYACFYCNFQICKTSDQVFLLVPFAKLSGCRIDCSFCDSKFVVIVCGIDAFIFATPAAGRSAAEHIGRLVFGQPMCVDIRRQG